ncbi:MAG TPA: phosphatase PAP2 family protein [Chitinophagaceae bacterium]|nr:phosphatase PAP2 family protein [Chitinophagaceae bacterium]
MIYLLRGKKWNWLWIWAALTSYAQVYVGKHYPSDVLVGALIGYILGSSTAKIFEYVVIAKEYNFLPGFQWKNSKELTH